MQSSFFRAAHGLAAEARTQFRALRSPWLVGLLALTAVLLALVAQLPLHYTLDIGREEGYGGDLPLIEGFYPFEPEDKASPLNWRWTSERVQVLLPSLGTRALGVTVRTLPVNREIAEQGAQTWEVWVGGRQLGIFPIRSPGGDFTFLLPAANDWRGDNGFEIRSATIAPTGDQRTIGLPIDMVTVESVAGPRFPAPATTLGWLGVALLAWLAVRRCGFTDRIAFVLLVVPALLLVLATALDPPRAAFGVTPGLVALVWGLGLTTVLTYVLPPLATRIDIPLSATALRWLVLLSFLAFVLRYGGKIYPQSMWGDIGFHNNRFLEVAGGRVLLLSRNRGVDFPYPPAFYLLLAPFTLLGFDPRSLLPFAGALVDAFSPVLVYVIGTLAFGRRKHSQIWAVAAAGLYSLSAATFMTTWWGFSTHIFTQFAHLLLVTTLVVLVPRMLARPEPTRLVSEASILAMLFCLVFLGHFGFWMNMSLLCGIGMLALVLAAWRGWAPWRAVWAVGIAFIAAEAISGATFYSAYTGLFLAQAEATRESGLTGMAGRAAIPTEVLWRALWDSGFRVHFGFFPVPLALTGGLLWFVKGRRSCNSTVTPVVLTLLLGTFAVASAFAALPFISGSSLSTRWLMFSAWAVAIAAVYLVRATWQRGWVVRVVYVVMASYILWVTANQWLGALAFRIRPPEPF